VDPLEFRLHNALAQDDLTGLGYRAEETLGYRECLDAIRPDYESAVTRVAAFNADVGNQLRRRGVGLAGMWYRFGKLGRPVSQAEAELGMDGHITIYCSGPDYGQGVETVFSQLAADSLGISRAALRLVNADTSDTLDGDVTGASRATYWVGSAVADAARRLRVRVLGTAAEMLDQSPDTLVLTDDAVRSVRDPQRQATLAAVAAELERSGLPRRIRGQIDLTPQFPDGQRLPHLPMFLTGAQMAEVEVNLETGQMQVLLMVAAHDVGRAINPRDAQGQIEGGIVMGLGAVLMEEFIPGISSGFGDYYVPTIRSVPEIRVHLVEVPSRYGVLGAKGLGEAVLLPTAPAIVNALSRAIGARVRSLPATSEKILAAIRSTRDG
jgi:CO/xanthine dehydrogenase Mo-binding subunit